MQTSSLAGYLVYASRRGGHLLLRMVSQVGAMQVRVLLEGALSIQILFAGLFVLVDCKTGLKDYHGQQCGHATDAGQPSEAWLG